MADPLDTARASSHHDAPLAGSSVAEHRDRILNAITPLAAVPVALAQALRRTLAHEVTARVDVPGFDNSSMDGYAVRSVDARAASEPEPVALAVIADLPAGSGENPRLEPGQAARIMTGAPIPDDADCVVPIEDTDQGRTTVLIRRAPEAGAYIRLAGSDVSAGDLVLSAGRTLNPRDLAAAAAAGVSELLVYPAPRVGILSTGSELRPPGAPLSRGQIHDSNSLLLAAAVEECGGVPVVLATVSDDEAALRAALEANAGELDAIITSGGVSVGAYDVVKAVLAPLGVWFGPVRMQPGKPQGFGRWQGGAPIFALPGNPVSVFVSFEAFVRPALLKLQGRNVLTRPVSTATVSAGWRSPADRAQYMPVTVERQPNGAISVHPSSSGGSGSHLVASLAGADALAIIPESVTEIHGGDTVDVTLVR